MEVFLGLLLGVLFVTAGGMLFGGWGIVLTLCMIFMFGR